MAGGLDLRAAGGKRLRDKVCIVTGAGQGIGRATARQAQSERPHTACGELVEPQRCNSG